MIRLAGKKFSFGPILTPYPGESGSNTYQLNHNLNSVSLQYDIRLRSSLSDTTYQRVSFYASGTTYRGVSVESTSMNSVNLIVFKIFASGNCYVEGDFWA